jgi:hypothetical protein
MADITPTDYKPLSIQRIIMSPWRLVDTFPQYKETLIRYGNGLRIDVVAFARSSQSKHDR